MPQVHSKMTISVSVVTLVFCIDPGVVVYVYSSLVGVYVAQPGEFDP